METKRRRFESSRLVFVHCCDDENPNFKIYTILNDANDISNIAFVR